MLALHPDLDGMLTGESTMTQYGTGRWVVCWEIDDGWTLSCLSVEAESAGEALDEAFEHEQCPKAGDAPPRLMAMTMRVIETPEGECVDGPKRSFVSRNGKWEVR